MRNPHTHRSNPERLTNYRCDSRALYSEVWSLHVQVLSPSRSLSLTTVDGVSMPFTFHISRLRAAALVHHHAGEAGKDHVGFLVEVQHGDGAELTGGAAGRRGVRGCYLGQVGVRVLLQGHVAALAGAVVGLVLLRGHYEVPAEVLEVHPQLVPAAEVRRVQLVAVERCPPHPALGLQRGDLYVGHLERK